MRRRQFLSGCAALALGWTLPVAAQPRQRLVRQQLMLGNPAAAPLREATAWFYVPMRRAAGQTRLELHIDAPHRLHDDARGNTLVEVPIRELAPFDKKLVRVQAVLGEQQQTVLDDPAGYLGPEPYIEADAAPLRELAQTLRQAAPPDTARAIYHWVRGNLVYAGFVAEDQGAAYALRQRRGDCTEYAYLVTALARACGIPARAMGGYVLERDGLARSVDYHNWCELWLDGQWQVVDAQKEDFLPPPLRYIAYRVVQRTAAGAAGISKFGGSPGLKVTME
ncbi:transglutaminase domain-containing protein [Chitiniphilus purpureus]|uniref:Transglutaminase domain-containing protein n=1 Tax=Chitiniphilus purpureus TaxID=2981137 RepID=A0ABY6DLH8_9NEIS|nr:transglutaminase domain-containing protein [Chitiniphilus sp. CD1]UXY15210.1 transglutaminase domain-containing protein [Chitiniphilus sp. CD1]